MIVSSSTQGLANRFWALSWKLKLATVLASILLIFVSTTMLLNAYNYSVGTRTGVIDKISEKGFACWTTEGQLALPNFSRPGTLRSKNESVDNTFYFSVPDPDIKKQIEAIPPGSPVTVEYRQKLFALAWPIPFFCVRRTQYELVGVKPAPSYQPNSPFPARP